MCGKICIITASTRSEELDMLERSSERKAKALGIFLCVEILKIRKTRIPPRQWLIADFLYLKMNDP